MGEVSTSARGSTWTRETGDDRAASVEGTLSSVTVLVVEDKQLFAEALGATLREEGAEIVEVASSGRAALRAVEFECPDVVLMDLGLADESGITVGRKLLELHPGLKLIALASTRHAGLASAVVGAGFHGFLTKDARMHHVISAIRTVLNGQIVISQGVPDEGSRLGRRQDTVALLADQLTRRELEVLTLLTRGAPSSQIAAELRIRPNTVRTHVQGVLAKLQVHSRLEAAAFAVRNGLVDVDGPLRRADAS